MEPWCHHGCFTEPSRSLRGATGNSSNNDKPPIMVTSCCVHHHGSKSGQNISSSVVLTQLQVGRYASEKSHKDETLQTGILVLVGGLQKRACRPKGLAGPLADEIICSLRLNISTSFVCYCRLYYVCIVLDNHSLLC